MLAYSLKRLLLAVLVAVTVSVGSFALLRAAGDPAVAMAGHSATASDIEFIRETYGFNRPLPVQYADWLVKALQGDFGESLYFRMPVSRMLADKLPTTMTLGGLALAFALCVGLPLGIIAAIRPNSWIDRTALLVSVTGQAMPTFWFALVLVVLFSITFPLLPPSGSGTWKHFVMPTVVLGYYATPAIMRLTRAGMLDVLASDYIRTARAKGLHPAVVLLKHALRNAVIPVVSLSAVQFGFMLGGSVVVETVFALHGTGQLAWESISRSDLPTVQAIVLVLSSFYVVLSLIADLLNAWLDPRIRVA
ncbi:ABC transporter permease (plasmid) [Azospirillum argentinense]|uniref:ABC transporter permease n=1 Tax=Azospirillum argentinense TaxID=2970906 RepID=A0A060DSK0_9PROT|nr:ABC transporter permease [Azospirillum argentinense]AIB15767.1 ABC transporter permease [Azospirillum argentinense]EZQ03273.1 ABC transporter permease [Azospirillum argentinense]MBK3798489.1 ABC transporter permease subunit [Azospirillum argentinense]